MTNPTDVLIIGAGIAGLMAATKLTASGLSVTVLDKGRGVGGRMATRRIANGRADHGAQFFTVRNPEFNQYVQQWQQAGLVREWSQGWSDGSARAAEADGHPRYIGSSGMTTVPKHLATKLNVQTGVTITAVTPTASGWHLRDSTNTSHHTRALLLTPPVPQSLALLAHGGTDLHPADADALARIQYDPSLTGIFWIDGKVGLPAPGAIQRPDHDFPWIADNQRKGISNHIRLITVHAAPRITRQLWDAPEEEKIEVLLSGLRPFLTASAIVIEAQTHRWRYAIPTTLHPDHTLLAQNLPPLAFAGDAFNGPRVEGAAVSGLTAAHKLQSAI